jgi:hypothetical protein
MPDMSESQDGIAGRNLDIPPLLLDASGSRIDTTEEWRRVRRPELLDRFSTLVYGRTPRREELASLRVSWSQAEEDVVCLDGLAVRREIEVACTYRRRALSIGLLLYLPRSVDGESSASIQRPVFLGLNFNGNHTISSDPGIRLSSGYVNRSPERGIPTDRSEDVPRGHNGSRWPLELILRRGYGLATAFCGDIDPDFHDGFENGVHGLTDPPSQPRGREAWGTIGGWAWGLSRCMDYLVQAPGVDSGRIAGIGHSRLGKTALWAAAQDERFAMVVSNDSGCGGAALFRRKSGETIADITRNFPHWFCEAFTEYAGRDEELPVDQHMLLALIAPRPLYVASASADAWADPEGEYLSAYIAGEVYRLYDRQPPADPDPPPPGGDAADGTVGYHLRIGSHGIGEYDWIRYLDFADRNLGTTDDFSRR